MAKCIKVLAGLGLAGGIGLLIWLWRPLSANPDAQQLSKAAENYQVEILRDEWGVPHIVGTRNVDTTFGLAYAHAEDDYETIQETVAAARGTLAQYRGLDVATTDYLVNLMGVWATVEQRYTEIPKDVIDIAEAYAAGLNLYASEHPEKTWRGLAPFTAKDMVAGFVFKTPLFYGLDKPLLDLFDENTNLEIALVPSDKTASWAPVPRGLSERGSNAIAVTANRSTDNTTRLLINSHQPMTGPVAWYEAHLHAEQGWRVHGGVFPGTPVVLHGFTPNLGWASTVNHIDLWDEYLLTRNPANDNQYLLDDKWHDFDVKDVTILIKLWGNFRYPAKRKVLRSEHGPIIESGGKTYAIRYAGMDEIGQLEQYIRLNQSIDLDTFMQAMSLVQLPSINFIYADKDDNIGFIHNAQYPSRLEGWNWRKGLPGDRSDLIWRGYRPFSDVPKLINPQSGLLFNANNTPFSATDGPDNLRPDQFPVSMGLADNQTNRALRLLEMNDGTSAISERELLRQKFDIEYSTQSDHYQALKAVLAQNWSGSPKLVRAQEIIRKWDRRANTQNRNAAVPITVIRELHENKDPKDRSAETLRLAVERATSYLFTHYGRLDPEWGEVNRLVRGKFNQPVDGGPDLLRAIYSQGQANDEKAYATTGDTWIALVSWDKSGKQKAKVIHQFGSATLDKESKHYADQAELFVKHEWRDATFDLEQVRAKASRVYTLGSLD